MMVLLLHNLGEPSTRHEFQHSFANSFEGMRPRIIVALQPVFGNLLRQVHQSKPLMKREQKEQKVVIPKVFRQCSSEELRMRRVAGKKGSAVKREYEPLIVRIREQ